MSKRDRGIWSLSHGGDGHKSCCHHHRCTILTLSPEELFAIGAQNRVPYLEKTVEFQTNFKTLITQTKQQLYPK